MTIIPFPPRPRPRPSRVDFMKAEAERICRELAAAWWPYDDPRTTLKRGIIQAYSDGAISEEVAIQAIRENGLRDA